MTEYPGIWMLRNSKVQCHKMAAIYGSERHLCSVRIAVSTFTEKLYNLYVL